MTMETTAIFLDKQIAEQATSYADKHGTNLSALIESYLSRLLKQTSVSEEETPDIVLSLLGAGEPVDKDDLNGRRAYQEHLLEKHK